MTCSVSPAEGTSGQILPRAHQADPELVSLKQHMCTELGLHYEHDFMLQYKVGVYYSVVLTGLSVNISLLGLNKFQSVPHKISYDSRRLII